jgi:hypothetical protein
VRALFHYSLTDAMYVRRSSLSMMLDERQAALSPTLELCVWETWKHAVHACKWIVANMELRGIVVKLGYVRREISNLIIYH